MRIGSINLWWRTEAGGDGRLRGVGVDIAERNTERIGREVLLLISYVPARG